MHIVVRASRFEGGSWKLWEHTCSEAESEAVADSAKAKAFEHFGYRVPTDADYLAAVSYLFNVARGLPSQPAEGDIQVYGVLVTNSTILRISEVEPTSVR